MRLLEFRPSINNAATPLQKHPESRRTPDDVKGSVHSGGKRIR